MYFLEKLVGLGVDDGVTINSVVQQLFLIMGVWPLVSGANIRCEGVKAGEDRQTGDPWMHSSSHPPGPLLPLPPAHWLPAPLRLATPAGLHRAARPFGQVGQRRACLALHYPKLCIW